MAKEWSRGRRIGEQMKRELAELIRFELGDPRVGMVTVSGVEVSRDMAHATVYVTMLNSEGLESALAALHHAAGYLRRELGRRMRVRTIPELHFAYDSSFETGARISALLDRMKPAEGDETEPK